MTPEPTLERIYLVESTWTLQGVPNVWEKMPLSNPLGFKHNPLEGPGSDKYIYQVVKLISQIPDYQIGVQNE